VRCGPCAFRAARLVSAERDRLDDRRRRGRQGHGIGAQHLRRDRADHQRHDGRKNGMLLVPCHGANALFLVAIPCGKVIKAQFKFDSYPTVLAAQ